MKSYIVLGIGVVTFLVGIFFFWLSGHNPTSLSAGLYGSQVQKSTQPATSSASPNPPSPPSISQVTISPNQTSTSWLDSQALIKQCRVESVDVLVLESGSPQIFSNLYGTGIHIVLKNLLTLSLIDSPPPGALDATIQSVSSTCGTITVTRRQVNID